MALKLKHTVDTIEEIPIGQRDFYSKSAEGKYTLEVEGLPSESARLKEFRENNIALNREIEELRPLKTKYEGIEPEAARAALARPDSTKLEADLVAERTAHAATQFKHIITQEFLRAGGRSSAVDFMTAEAAKVFAIEDGKVTTKEFSTTNPSDPLSINEWLTKQTQVADFAFQPSRGGGAAPTHTGSPKFGARSNQKTLRNPTPHELGANASAIAKGEIKIEYT